MNMWFYTTIWDENHYPRREDRTFHSFVRILRKVFTIKYFIYLFCIDCNIPRYIVESGEVLYRYALLSVLSWFFRISMPFAVCQIVLSLGHAFGIVNRTARFFESGNFAFFLSARLWYYPFVYFSLHEVRRWKLSAARNKNYLGTRTTIMLSCWLGPMLCNQIYTVIHVCLIVDEPRLSYSCDNFSTRLRLSRSFRIGHHHRTPGQKWEYSISPVLSKF